MQNAVTKNPGVKIKNLSRAKSTRLYSIFERCHLCHEWGWMVSKAFEGCPLCIPCYVDVLEERQRARSGEVRGRASADPIKPNLGEGPDQRPASEPHRQMDLFE